MDLYNCTEDLFTLGGADGGGVEEEEVEEAGGGTTTPPRSAVLLTLTLSAVAVMTTAINSLVITAIIVTRKLHHPANYLICSLAVTDLLVAILVMPISIIYIQRESWVMGQLVCTLWLSVDITCCTCSILHLAAIALDRYRAITDAVEYARKRTGLRAGLTVAVVWFLAVLISLPPLLWMRHIRDTGDGDQCLITHHHMAFTLYSTLGAFYIPLLLILVLYYKIYRAAKTLYLRREASRASCRSGGGGVINGSMLPSAPTAAATATDGGALSPVEKSGSDPSTEGERARIAVTSPRSVKLRREQSFRQQSFRQQRISGTRERKAASTLGLILGAFVVCWLPFFIKEVIVNTCDSCSISTEMADFLTWLGYLNSLINPLIYTIFNEDFKKAFQRLVRCRHYL